MPLREKNRSRAGPHRSDAGGCYSELGITGPNEAVRRTVKKASAG